MEDQLARDQGRENGGVVGRGEQLAQADGSVEHAVGGAADEDRARRTIGEIGVGAVELRGDVADCVGVEVELEREEGVCR